MEKKEEGKAKLNLQVERRPSSRLRRKQKKLASKLRKEIEKKKMLDAFSIDGRIRDHEAFFRFCGENFTPPLRKKKDIALFYVDFPRLRDGESEEVYSKRIRQYYRKKEIILNKSKGGEGYDRICRLRVICVKCGKIGPDRRYCLSNQGRIFLCSNCVGANYRTRTLIHSSFERLLEAKNLGERWSRPVGGSFESSRKRH